MILQKPDKDIQTFFSQIHSSYLKNQKRDLNQDFAKLLKISNIKWTANFCQRSISEIPTIVAVNHFVRPWLHRKNFFTTFDSMITSAIVTLSYQKISKRKLTWVTKDNLQEKILFLHIKTRKIQLEAIDCYNFIGISKNYPFARFEKWQQYFKNGFDIAFYPEGKTSNGLKKVGNRFIKLLKFLKQHKIVFQILPVSIYLKKSQFLVNFSKILMPQSDHAQTIEKTMI